MSITAETRQAIRDILRHVVFQAIPVRWRSSERMPGAGDRTSFFRGSGDDYDGSTEYVPGDDPREIDWNAYAATGGQQVLTNLYREPRDIKSFILADVSATMNFGTARVTKRHLAAEMAASCAKSMDETRDRLGLVLFSGSKVEKHIPTRAATRMMLPTLAGILETQQSANATGGGLTKALKVLPGSRSLVFIVSDFMNMNDDDWTALRNAARRHDIICFYVQDIRERELPEISWGKGPLGWLMNRLGCFYTLQDWSGNRKTIWVSKKTRAQYAANFRQHEASIVARFKNARCRWLVVSTEEGDSAFPKIIKTLSGHK